MNIYSATYQMIGNFTRNMNLESEIQKTWILKFYIKYLTNSKRFSDFCKNFQGKFLVACTRLYTPLCRSVRRSVGPLVRHTLLFRRFIAFWPYRSCPNAPETSNMAPAHPHATGVAVYPALF